MSLSGPDFPRKSAIEIAGLAISGIALVSFVGTVWLIWHLARRSGGLGNLGDATIASLAAPVALAGIIGMVFVALNAGVAGFAYWYLVRREAFVQGNPLRAPTRTQFVVFIEIALLWAAVVASSYRKLEWSLMVSIAAFAVPALTAFVLESFRLCNRPLPTKGWARWTVLRTAVGAVAATFAFALPIYAAGVFGGIAATEQAKSFLPREVWFAFFFFFALLTNYVVSLGGRWRVAFLAVYSVGTLALFAPSAIAELPFRVLGLADFNALLLPADARAEAFHKVHAECGTEPRLRPDNALIVHVRSSVGSDYIVDCTKREWARIPKGQVAAELAPMKANATAVPAQRSAGPITRRVPRPLARPSSSPASRNAIRP